MLRSTTLVLATVIIIGCSTPAAERDSPAPLAAAAEPTPTASARATPTASPGPTPLATPDPTPLATPASIPLPVTADELKIAWKAGDPEGLPAVSSIVDVVHTDDGYVLVAERYLDEEFLFAAWWSTDGRTWQLGREFPIGHRIFAMTAGGPGFVLGGSNGTDALIWTSSDGRTWEAAVDASLQGGWINKLVPTAGGVVAFGRRSASNAKRIWTSPDGFTWLAATNDSGLTVARGLQAVGSYDGRAIAFVSEGRTKPAAIWETTGHAEWTRTGSLPTVGAVSVVAGGARGWIALGTNEAWISADGRAFDHVKAGPDVAADVVVDDAGFIVVGYVGSLPFETCGDQRPFEGHTWTSTDGRTWQKMRVTGEFKAAMVTELLVVDRTLVGYGHRITESETLDIGRWTARLPAVSLAADASDKASRFQSCGG